MMKKIIGLFLAFQMVGFNGMLSMATELPLKADNNTDEQPIKICCKDANGNEIPYPSGGGLSGGAVTGIVLGSAAGAVILGMAAKKFLERSKFENISIFEAESIINSLDVKGIVVPYNKNKLLSKAFDINTTAENMMSAGEKPVALLTHNNKNTISGDDKVVIFRDSEIRDKTLHLYTVKLPPELWNFSEKINIDAVIVFDSPIEVIPVNNTHNINIRLFNNIKPKRIATIISNHDYNRFNEQKGVIKESDINLVSDNPDRNLYTIEKGFELDKSCSEKPLVFAVSCIRNLKKEEMDYTTNYAVVLKIKNQSN